MRRSAERLFLIRCYPRNTNVPRRYLGGHHVLSPDWKNLIRKKLERGNGEIINGRVSEREGETREKRAKEKEGRVVWICRGLGSKPNKLAPPRGRARARARPRYKILNMNGRFCIRDELLFGETKRS